MMEVAVSRLSALNDFQPWFSVNRPGDREYRTSHRLFGAAVMINLKEGSSLDAKEVTPRRRTAGTGSGREISRGRA